MTERQDDYAWVGWLIGIWIVGGSILAAAGLGATGLAIVFAICIVAGVIKLASM